MNNRGQSLVIFIMLLPVILVLIAGTIDVGNFLVIKNNYENDIKSTIRYGLRHLEDQDNLQKMYSLIDSNISGNKNIEVKNETIKIKASSKVKSLFSNIINFDYQIDVSYIGYNENGKIKIKKE